jgi:hypothetical protein
MTGRRRPAASAPRAAGGSPPSGGPAPARRPAGRGGTPRRARRGGRRAARAPGRATAGWAAIVLAVLLAAAPAWPHASLVRSSPARRATLTTAPDRVQLWFSEPIEARFSSASVWDAAGRQVDRGDARVEPDDPKRLTLGLQPLAPGTYRVRFRVLSVDGHVVESEFPFTLR